MNRPYHIINARIINEGDIFDGELIIKNSRIDKIIKGQSGKVEEGAEVIDINGKYLLPGVIDDQVHFREPGLTHKADIYSESKAAVAGGITSYMDMPNTVPPVLSHDLLEDKYRLAAQKSLANYSFYMGASNDNIDEIIKTDPLNVCGVKVFMGSSTGNMLVDDLNSLNDIFSKSNLLVAVHCEDEDTIRKNLHLAREKYGEDVPIEMHPVIRTEEACYKSSSLAVKLAQKHNTRLHILHLSTARELDLFDNKISLDKKRITAEVCVHHLWFSDEDYKKKGTCIKWNPAIKTLKDKEGLLSGILNGKIDVVATDHAPHTGDEKQNTYFKAPSGGPLVQHSLIAMFELALEGKMSFEQVVEKMCHNPAICFQVDKRGFLREGYWADLTVVDTDAAWAVDKSNVLYKCGWSPFEGETFRTKVTHTFVNGNLVYNNGRFDESNRGQRLKFNR
ncbi:MAG: dihydroorotase [Bacteroidales bacterium]|nr:dihydroorotase [Bacteroidales bacterium]